MIWVQKLYFYEITVQKHKYAKKYKKMFPEALLIKQKIENLNSQ